MLLQIIITVGLVLFLGNLILNLKTIKRPRLDSKVPDPAPMVSILVPARNEEENIRACVESLQKQDYPNFEILVLDDNSSDNTAGIVSQIAAKDKKVRLLSGTPLPEDWAGKPFACQQLAKQAKGSWLLFTDADTTHAPHMIRSTLEIAINAGASLLSGFPRQLANSLPQKIAIPMMYFIIMSWLPLWWMQSSKANRPSLAIGQFLLFPKDKYWEMGGHEVVKTRILEDVWLGVEINRRGGKHLAIDLSPVVYCNMYNKLSDMWDGFIRWIHSVAALSPIALAGLLLAGYLFFLVPFYSLWNELVMTPTPHEWRPLIFFQVLIVLAMRWLSNSNPKGRLLSTIFHPVGITFLIVSAFYATAQQLTGGGIRWKKRIYSSESGVQ